MPSKSTQKFFRQKLTFHKLHHHILTLFAPRPLGRCATSKESFYTENEYKLSYHKVDVEYFFIRNFFEKKNSIFGENCEKLFWGHI